MSCVWNNVYPTFFLLGAHGQMIPGHTFFLLLYSKAVKYLLSSLDFTKVEVILEAI